MKPLIIRDTIFRDGSFRLCVTLASTGIQELRKDLVELKSKEFDLLEWRADYLINKNELMSELSEGLELIRISFPDKPILFTFRWDQEGGKNPISISDLYLVRNMAAESGHIDLMDVEMHWLRNTQSDEKMEMYVRLLEKMKSSGIRCILSWHDFNGTPEENMLLKILVTQMRLGADICKITTMAKTEEDTSRVLEVSRHAAEILDVPHIALVMGDHGMSSRYARTGSQTCITFAPLNQSSAPGQLSLDELKRRIEIMD
ncbi:type I 3-dehydroquinate dehydratase [Proteiniclasticum sp.]|uniref:type I 3-dehydroquinate dehydratase n=1 Tax=Proteiniclasticum sp. TaxID=2053595 RepID=UPI0028A2B863|nr:type I 3-dehydroquinate dehydratase [Proteiniclasticum sp.]